MKHQFTIGRRARVEENIPNNYQIIDLNSYHTTKSLVLVLGGNGTTDDRSANGNAKIVSSMLGVFNDDVEILSVNYNQGLGEPNITENCKVLVDKLFLPYVSINGERLDIDTACKNMRNITVFAHCRGVDGPMRRIVPILQNRLMELNYNTAEREQIISQIVMVAYGANLNDTIKEIKGVYCLSFSDEMYPSGAALLSKQFLNKLDIINMVKSDRELLSEIDISKKRDLIAAQLSTFLQTHRRVYNINEGNNIRLLAYGLLQTDNHIWEADHTIIGLTREDDWSSHKNASSTGDCVSRCLACALCNSVANSIINQKSDLFVDFDMVKLQNQIDTICKQHNYEQTKLDNVDLELL